MEDAKQHRSGHSVAALISQWAEHKTFLLNLALQLMITIQVGLLDADTYLISLYKQYLNNNFIEMKTFPWLRQRASKENAHVEIFWEHLFLVICLMILFQDVTYFCKYWAHDSNSSHAPKPSIHKHSSTVSHLVAL